MDPTINSTPTPTGPAPLPPQQPAMPNIQPAPVEPAAPAPEPIMSNQPVMGGALQQDMVPEIEPQMTPDQAFEQSAPAPDPAYGQQMTPSQAFEEAPTISATDPITQPEPLPAPDPIAETLSQPLKAADPVPGSIGSAVSMGDGNSAVTAEPAAPAQDPFANAQPTNTPNVSFTDPIANNTMNISNKSDQKKRTTLIALIAGIFVVIVAIIAMLAISLGGSKPSQSANTTQENQQEQKQEDKNPKTPVSTKMSCSYDLEESDLTILGNATAGSENINTTFEDDKLSEITETITLTYETPELAETGVKLIEQSYLALIAGLELEKDPFESTYSQDEEIVDITHYAKIEKIDKANAEIFNITTNEDGDLKISQSDIKAALKNKNYICEED